MIGWNEAILLVVLAIGAVVGARLARRQGKGTWLDAVIDRVAPGHRAARKQDSQPIDMVRDPETGAWVPREDGTSRRERNG